MGVCVWGGMCICVCVYVVCGGVLCGDVCGCVLCVCVCVRPKLAIRTVYWKIILTNNHVTILELSIENN